MHCIEQAGRISGAVLIVVSMQNFLIMHVLTSSQLLLLHVSYLLFN